MILTEFDTNKTAVINPTDLQKRITDFPETVISIFDHVLFNRIVAILRGKQIARYHDIDGIWPIYEAAYQEHRFAFAKARLGAPACVGSFEGIIALGIKRIVLLGNCGVLDKDIADCSIIIPTRAIRDEGTSYQYAPAADLIDVNRKHRVLFKKMLKEYGYSYVEGTTWTTDAFYRETPEKVEHRKNMGAICVEMECSAMQALCDFREIDFFQFFYAADNLDHEQWEPRSLSGQSSLSEKEKIALLAVELACRIERKQLDGEPK